MYVLADKYECPWLKAYALASVGYSLEWRPSGSTAENLIQEVMEVVPYVYRNIPSASDELRYSLVYTVRMACRNRMTGTGTREGWMEIIREAPEFVADVLGSSSSIGSVECS